MTRALRPLLLCAQRVPSRAGQEVDPGRAGRAVSRQGAQLHFAQFLALALVWCQCWGGSVGCPRSCGVQFQNYLHQLGWGASSSPCCLLSFLLPPSWGLKQGRSFYSLSQARAARFSVCHASHKHPASGLGVGTGLAPHDGNSSRHQELQPIQCPKVPSSRQGLWTDRGPTTAARSQGRREARAARARAWMRAAGQTRALGRGQMGHRNPQRDRHRGWRWPLSATGAPADARSLRAPRLGRRAARGPGAPHRRCSPRGSCRKALRAESRVRHGVGCGVQGARQGRAGSLTRRCRGP